MVRRWAAAGPDLIPLALAGIVEGAWLSVIYASWQVGLAHGPMLLGPLALAVPAWIGLWWIRSGTSPQTEVVGLALLTVAAAAVGVAVEPAALGAFLGGDPAGAVASHAAGVLAGLAVLRGARHRHGGEEDAVVGGLLRWGLPLLALPWVVGGVSPGPWRTAFAAAAFPSTILFVTAGLLDIGLARLEGLESEAGRDWDRRRSWLVLAGGVLALMALVAIPTALIIGAPLGSVIDGLLGPVAALLGLLLLPVFALGVAILAGLELVPLHPLLTSAAPGASASRLPSPGADAADPAVALGAAILVVIGFVLLIVLVARWDLGRRRAERPSRVARRRREERSVALPDRFGLPAWRPPALRRLGVPRTASAAYVSWLVDLEGRPGRERRPAETPSGHAARLRRDAGLPFSGDLLAADFELERYAGRRLGPTETRRAVGRWRRLRDRLAR